MLSNMQFSPRFPHFSLSYFITFKFLKGSIPSFHSNLGRPQTETQYGHDCERCVVDRQEPQGFSRGNEPNVASVCYI